MLGVYFLLRQQCWFFSRGRNGAIAENLSSDISISEFLRQFSFEKSSITVGNKVVEGDKIVFCVNILIK